MTPVSIVRDINHLYCEIELCTSLQSEDDFRSWYDKLETNDIIQFIMIKMDLMRHPSNLPGSKYGFMLKATELFIKFKEATSTEHIYLLDAGSRIINLLALKLESSDI